MYTFTEKDFTSNSTNLICVEANYTWAIGSSFTIGKTYSATKSTYGVVLVANDDKCGYICFEIAKLNNHFAVRFIPETILDDMELFIYKLSGVIPEKFLQKCLK